MTGYPSSFADQPVHVREKIILSWVTAKVPIYRQLFKQLTMLVKQNWVKSSPTIYKLLNFPYVPIHMKPGKSFEFEFIQIPPGSSAEIIETDVIIVGSGCGSAVSAKNIAEAGHRVLVVDKAYHWPAEHLPMKESDGWNHMFMNGGAMFCGLLSTICIHKVQLTNMYSRRRNYLRHCRWCLGWRRNSKLVRLPPNPRLRPPRMGLRQPPLLHLLRIPGLTRPRLRPHGRFSSPYQTQSQQ
jgi:hypothetical protein